MRRDGRIPAQLLPPTSSRTGAQARRARRGEDVIDFSMGNPDQPTPRHIVEKLVETVQRPDTHRYSVSKGIPRLRRAICNWYQARYGVELDPDSEAIVTIGSKEGLAHLTLATLDTGDIVLVPNPSYPIHIYGPVIAGADIRHVPMHKGVDFSSPEGAIATRAETEMLSSIFQPSDTQCVELRFSNDWLRSPGQPHYVVHALAYPTSCLRLPCPVDPAAPGARDVAGILPCPRL